MADLIGSVTPLDLRDESLHIRLIRRVATAINKLGDRLSAVETGPKPMTIIDIRAALSAGGQAPLNVGSLQGQLARPQLAKALSYSTAPTGAILQALSDGQLVVVGGAIYEVVGGNPNTLQSVGSFNGGTVTSTITLTPASGAALNVTAGQINSSSQFATSVYNSAAQTLTNNTITAITFDTESYDRGSCHDNAVNPARITVPTGGAGLWIFGGFITYAANNTGSRAATLRGNGAATLAQTRVLTNTTAAALTSIPVTAIVSVVDADYVELLGFQDSGGNLNANSGFGTTGFYGYKLC